MLEQSKTTSKIDEAIFKVQGEAPVIKKKSDNEYYRSKYAEYPDIQQGIKPLLIAAQIQVKSFPVEGNKLVFILTHLPSQEFYKATIDLNSVSASPQAQGSAITYMKRYALTAALDLIIEGDDDDGNSSSNKPKNQQQQPAAQQTQPPANLPWLNQNTKDWFNAKWNIFNNKKSLDHVKKTFKVNAKNAEVLLKAEDLKPGTAYWNLAVEYLAKDGSKAEKITSMFNVTETDLQDLQIDATNYTPAGTPQTETK